MYIENEDSLVSRVWGAILNEIRELRSLNMTLEAIGKKMGVSKPTVQRWLEGAVGGEKTALVDILKYLNALELDPVELLFPDYAKVYTSIIADLEGTIERLSDENTNKDQRIEFKAKQLDFSNALFNEQKVISDSLSKVNKSLESVCTKLEDRSSKLESLVLNLRNQNTEITKRAKRYVYEITTRQANGTIDSFSALTAETVAKHLKQTIEKNNASQLPDLPLLPLNYESKE